MDLVPVLNQFNDEVTRVGTEGPRPETLPDTLPIGDAVSRWLDPASFCVTLPGAAGTPLGFVLARNEVPIGPREQGEFEIALTATARLVASAIQNIRHDTENRLRARLQHQQTYGSAP
jgi:hypothetical protein